MPLNLKTASGGSVILTGANTASDKTITVPAADGNMQLIQQGTAVASTSGTSIDFTSIPSWVKRITVMFSGVSTNGSSAVQVQLGDAGGIENSGYLHSFANTSSSVASTNFTSGFGISIGDAGAVRHGVISLNLIGSNIWACSMVIGRSDAAAGGNGAGSKTLSDTLDRVRITTVNGTDTFDAGTINIMWEG
jgi:hypothetical protein